VAGDLIQLNASVFNVLNGALASVTNGSRLTVNGNLVTLANGSTLNLLNGSMLNVSGNSVVHLGALIGFAGVGHTVNITNDLCPLSLCAGIGGLRVQLNANAGRQRQHQQPDREPGRGGGQPLAERGAPLGVRRQQPGDHRCRAVVDRGGTAHTARSPGANERGGLGGPASGPPLINTSRS
jgi:hypothetical protein